MIELHLKYIVYLTISLLLASCSKKGKDIRILAEVGGQSLYEDEISELSAKGLTSKDSADIINRYVKQWASDILYYNKAKESVTDNDEIEELVEKYRKSLIIYNYQLDLVSKGVSREISDDEVMKYYTENENLFKVSEPIFKGFYILVPNSSSEIDAFKVLARQADEVSYDVIESMCVKNAAKFIYFQDNWMTLSEIQRNVPLHVNPTAMMHKKHVYETSDSTQTMLFHIEDYKTEGDIQPFDYAEKKIRMIMYERKKTDFLRNYGNSLFDEAIQKGDLKIY